MKIAFIIYNGMTALDFAGMFDPITRLKTMGFKADLEWDVCAFTGKVVSYEGIEIIPSKASQDLSGYDCIVIPGGNGIADIAKNQDMIAWLKSARKDALMVSVCGGSIILGLMGFLAGRKATTHPALMPYLKKFAAETSQARIVEDGNVITGRGVTSAIDIGLYACEKIGGREAREKIQVQMDYPYYPPKAQ